MAMQHVKNQSKHIPHKKSKTESTIIHTNSDGVQSVKTQVVKRSRYHHNRSNKTQKQNQSNKKIKSTAVIHTTIRLKNNNQPKHNLKLSNVLKNHHYQNKSKGTIRPVSITTIDSYESPCFQSSDNSWYNKTSQTDLTKTTDKRNTAKDGWPDWTTFENEHHRNEEKKKKKHLRLCLIISLLACIFITIAITVILTVLLIKPKSNVRSPNITSELRWKSVGITVAGGQSGNGANQLNNPTGAILDSLNTLYVADWNNNRVQRYLKGASSATTVAGVAGGGWNTTSGYLHYPGDVTFDSNGNVHVAETFNNRVQLWTSGSSSGTNVFGTGAAGFALNELDKPYGITYDTNSGTLYIADTSNSRIIRLPSGASVGTEITCGNVSGPGTIQLSFRKGLFFDSFTNSLIIANYVKNNIIRYDLNTHTCSIIVGNKNGTSGSAATAFNLPWDVTLDPMGNIYVADQTNYRVQFFPVNQLIGTTIAGVTGVFGSNSTHLTNPTSVALDSQLNLYVTDTSNHRVQKFLRY